jgi:hypothetical protein
MARKAGLWLVFAAMFVLVGLPGRADAKTGTLTMTLTDYQGYVHTFTVTADASGSFTGTGVATFNGAYMNDETIAGSSDPVSGAILSWDAIYTNGSYKDYHWWWHGGPLVSNDSLSRQLGFTMSIQWPLSAPALAPWHILLAGLVAIAFLLSVQRRRARFQLKAA